jgi:N-acetylglucosaminyl-diphospho-decaprenol L-rhamnosyltransferase
MGHAMAAEPRVGAEPGATSDTPEDVANGAMVGPDAPWNALQVDGQAGAPTIVPDPRIGVVVLTYNRRREVLATVERLLSLPERPTVVVVDNGSSDGTPDALAERFPSVRCIRLTDNPGGAGRNAGVAACERPYVAFCDDDTRWEPGALRRAADLFDRYPRLGAICGKVLVGQAGRVDPICDLMAASPIRPRAATPGPAVLGFLAGAVLVRRSAFLAAGGFERRFFIGGEEELLALDMVTGGWDLAYVPEVVSHHHPSSEGRDHARRRQIQVRNRLWVAWLRRPLHRALDITVRIARQGRTDPDARAGLVEALRSLPWALAHRRVVPKHVERRIRALELDGRG